MRGDDRRVRVRVAVGTTWSRSGAAVGRDRRGLGRWPASRTRRALPSRLHGLGDVFVMAFSGRVGCAAPRTCSRPRAGAGGRAVGAGGGEIRDTAVWWSTTADRRQTRSVGERNPGVRFAAASRSAIRDAAGDGASHPARLARSRPSCFSAAVHRAWRSCCCATGRRGPDRDEPPARATARCCLCSVVLIAAAAAGVPMDVEP